MREYFIQLTGTMAVILVVAAVIAGSNLLQNLGEQNKSWKHVAAAGLLGGLFGIYGNLAGLDYHGAVISVRDIGPMLAGFTGGPLGGLLGGVIAGVHRYLMGGITAVACVVATCCIGLACGFLRSRMHTALTSPLRAFLTGFIMENFHLGVVLLLVKPWETALEIVKAIYVPFILINSVGFTLMIFMIRYIEQQRDLSIEKGRLQSDLKTATTIQHSLLPPITESYPGRKEVALAADMDAAKEVGGDFYDFFFVDQDRLAFLIGDVSGKNISGALFMVRAKQILQHCIRDLSPLAEAVRRANEALCENNEADMFVTAWIGILDLPTGQLHFVNAGHNPPVLLSAEGERTWLRRKGGFILGGMEGIPYKESSLTLFPGDKIFLYTDGVTEAADRTRALYGEERLMACLKAHEAESVDRIIQAVKAGLAAHVQGSEQFDDITMLCLEYKGSRAV
ncbi:MAG: SpoIIE family protein phosphatase [Lachnospiraceae bacterium]|nr:SpoIIE family protein phosphatase [Lachnospiraceae bacterium]